MDGSIMGYVVDDAAHVNTDMKYCGVGEILVSVTSSLSRTATKNTSTIPYHIQWVLYSITPYVLYHTW